MASTPFTISIDKEQLDAARKLLEGLSGTVEGETGAKAALRRSINKTLTHAQSSVVKRVASEVNLLQKNIRPMTALVRATLPQLNGKVIISRHAIRLIEFPYITSFVGTSVHVRKNRPAELFSHRFVSAMKSGHIGIFERRMKNGIPVARLPIDEAFGPSPGMVFYENSDQDMEEISDFFARTLDHEVEFILSQA